MEMASRRKSFAPWPYVVLGLLLGAVGLFGFTLPLIKLLLALPPQTGMRRLLLQQVETERILIALVGQFHIPAGAILGSCAGWAVYLRRNQHYALAERVSLFGAAIVALPLLYLLSLTFINRDSLHRFMEDLPVLLIWLGLPLLVAAVLMYSGLQRQRQVICVMFQNSKNRRQAS